MGIDPVHLGFFRVGLCYVDLYKSRGGSYCGTIFADPTSDPLDRTSWTFQNLRGPPAGFPDDRYLAMSACSFGGYYTSDNRGDDLPEWAPPAETADAISEASWWVQLSEEVEELDELPAWCSTVEEKT